LERLCQVKTAGQCPFFEVAILVDGVIPEAATMAKEAGLQVMSFAKVEAIGAQRIATRGHKHRPPSSKDTFTFCYTSGTTGDPKGALLSHENLISAVGGVSDVLPIQVWDRHLSYLPLAHIFERIVMCQMYVAGASIAFFRGDPLWLIEDLQACRPTLFPAAPRVLNKIYDKVRKKSMLAFLVDSDSSGPSLTMKIILYPLITNILRSKRALPLPEASRRSSLMPPWPPKPKTC
jgi:long-chain acyl-CoA synthetase